MASKMIKSDLIRKINDKFCHEKVPFYCVISFFIKFIAFIIFIIFIKFIIYINIKLLFISDEIEISPTVGLLFQSRFSK